jgi:MerR family transcriptional regulator, copper efflux regulator
MLIGKLAELTGVSRKAIRHYEEIGLIPEPDRKGTYRDYSEGYIPIIRLIKKSQVVGFSLSELQEIVERKSEGGEFPIALANDLIDRKILDINDEIDRLNRQEEALNQLKIELKNTFETS